ncbi:hypothetical protein [Tepidibacter aestuarii]|nr:hypothetical protein [Tepidibacter aestuarii]
MKKYINIIKNNLYFSLNYVTDNEKTRNFIVKLEVKEFDMD